MKSNQKIKFFLVFLFLNFQWLALFGQKDFKWDKEVAPLITVPDQYASEDAIMVYNNIQRQTLLTENSFFTRIIIRQRVKIMTAKGLDNFGKIFIPKISYLHIEKLDARTIKSDQSVVDLDAKDIKSISITDEDVFDKRHYFLYSIPGLEVGDEFEVVCIYEGYSIERGGNIYLHESIPVLEAKYELEVDKNIIVYSREFNGLPDPVVTKKGHTFQFTWALKDLAGIFDQKGTIYSKVLPYMIYELNFSRFNMREPRPEIKNWGELISHIDERDFKYTLRKKKKFYEAIDLILAGQEEKTKVEKIKVIHEYINEHIEIIKIKNNEQSNGLEYFLENKKADALILFKLYKAIFDYLEFDYYLATAKSKYHGEIQLNFPTDMQISHYLFAFNAADGSFHICFPKMNSKPYAFNELPLSLEGTTFYMLNPKEKETLKKISLPYSAYKQNRLTRKIKSLVNLEAGSIHQQFEKTYNGAFSNKYRNKYYKKQADGELKTYYAEFLEQFLPKAQLNEVSLTELPKTIPFRFSLKYDYQIDDYISKIDEKVYKIDMNDWFDHIKFNVNAEKRMLDYYPEFAGVDSYTYLIEFEQPIKLINKEQIELKVVNDIGSYDLLIQQNDPKQLLIKSRYIVKVNHIPVDKIKQLEKLNESVKTANLTELILELQ